MRTRRSTTEGARKPAIRLVGWLAIGLLLIVAGEAISYGYSLIPDPRAAAGADREELLAMAREDGIGDESRKLYRSPKHRDEMKTLYFFKARFHPYRWFALPSNFEGEYYRTDALGYLNDPDSVSQDKTSIAFFGGSTMFSIFTRPDHAIPAFVAEKLSPDLQVLNLGLAYYSTSAEMSAFIEAIRHYHGIRYAVFFDGVNEVTRFAEKLMYASDSDLVYRSMGYPGPDALQLAARQSPAVRLAVSLQFAAPERAFPYSMYYLKRLANETLKLLPGRVKPKPVSYGDEDYRRFAREIADLYVENVIDIAAIARNRGITPIFLLQPIIVHKPTRTSREESLVDGLRATSIDMEKLYRLSYARIVGDARLEALAFFDVTDAFAKAGGKPLFYDFGHVNGEGNRIIADRMMVVLRKVLPAKFLRGF